MRKYFCFFSCFIFLLIRGQNYVTTDIVPYLEKISIDHIAQVLTYRLEVLETTIVDQISEQTFQSLQDTFALLEQRLMIQKKPWVYVYIFPFRKTPDGKIEKLEKYHLQVYKSNQMPSELTVKTKVYATQSVLSSGKWYKISTTDGGIHRITYQDLVSWGINPTTINPKNIRIYGNGSRMLPERVGEPWIDDLYENPIYVYGEEDGKFDPGDYILFFSEGLSYWKYNGARSFNHETNLYTTKAYFYLNFDKGVGKRIQILDEMNLPANKIAETFYDFTLYEKNQYNLIKSGKNWYGDIFEYPNFSKNFVFSFPNICLDSMAMVKVAMAARSNITSQVKVSVGSYQSTIAFSPVGDYTTDYAKTNMAVLNFMPLGSNVTVQVQFQNNGNQQAQAWLDYIEIFTWRKLIMSGTQMVFRNPDLVGVGNVVEYRIGSSQSIQVWDISNPLFPMEVKGQWVNGVFSFRVQNDSLKTFLAFDGTQFHKPVFEGEIQNQNLHGLPQVDYIIVTHPMFYQFAREIGEYHFLHDGLSYVVVTPQQIYEEFSSGKQDISAIRNFIKMFYDRAQNADELPKYLLLFGDASYDYLDITSGNTNFVPTFQTQNSLSPTSSYLTDDFFGLLDDGEGQDALGSLDIGIGRFPVKTVDEAKAMVDKTKRYLLREKLPSTNGNCTTAGCPVSNFAEWKNWVTFVCDDGDGNLHFNQSERLARYVDTTYHVFNLEKIYLPAYPQISTSGGERAPEMNEAIRQRVEKGALIVNYTGHGGEVGWALERILDVPTIQNFGNRCNLPLFVTATCEFSRFDDPQRTSAGEYLFLNPNGGAVALFTTTRLAFSSFNEALNKSFFKKAFQFQQGSYPALGEIMMFCKNDNGSSSPLKNFTLLGDPAAKLAIPTNRVVVTKINGKDTLTFNDTIKALSKVSIEGKIVDAQWQNLSDFNGILYVTVFDKPSTYVTQSTEPGDYPAPFTLQKNLLYKGRVEVDSGEFKLDFFVPRDIQYQFGSGRMSFYADDGQYREAVGWFENFIIGGSNDTIIADNEGPSIELYLNDTLFREGGITDENPVLLVHLFDEHGINTTGNGIGHDLVAYLDGNRSEPIVLNDYFEADLNTYKSGIVRYPLHGLSFGWHTITVKAWDNLNISSEKQISFQVTSQNKLLISTLSNYPNPMNDHTTFVFEHNLTCCTFSAMLRIFDMYGRQVKVFSGSFPVHGYRTVFWNWDGTSDYGEVLPSGLYLYNLTLENEDMRASRSGKLVIIK
ncbi:MAG: type IX secretion system sortase PorU [Bacteroidales bacterium]|nr:type IX secretion system sortase PorU [Bacteroidales bacterium]